MSAQKLLIDTDPGQDIDDLLALLFALQREELDIRAITTVTYPATRRARLVKRLLRWLSREDIPVAAGMDYPLRVMSAEEITRQEDLSFTLNHACFAEPEDSRDEVNDFDAAGLIIRTVEAHPGEVAIACLAPLTNIACALQRNPGIAKKIAYIAMMGGEISLNRKENNVAFDAVAADVVLSSGIPIAMGTWDVTRRFVLTAEDCALFHHASSPLLQSIGQAIEAWHPAQSWKPGPVMYDVFPIIWAFRREFYQTESLPVRVETSGKYTAGMTVVTPSGAKIDVTTGIQQEELRKLYLETVFGAA
jgi:purine nucleosidase